MLQQMRKASKSPAASVVIGILVLAFALWGVADIFRGGADNVVAEVGKSQILDSQYDLLLKNQIRTLADQTKTDLTMEQARAMGLDRQVLDQAIGRAALDEQTNRLGLIATNSAISAQINSQFKGADRATILQTLQQSGYSEQGFALLTGQDIARRQMIDALVDGMVAPPGMVRLLYDLFNERRTAEYIVITAEEAGTIPEPSASDLEAYHKAHSDQFSSPEYRAFDYVQISPEQFSGEIQVSDDDLKTEYDAHKANYEKPEQREIEQITFPNKEAADAAKARIKTAADFATVARERGLSADDVKLGTLEATRMDPRLSAVAFKIPEGQVTDPVQGPFGWVILRAAKVISGENKSFDDVKAQIKTELVRQRAGAKLADIANAFEDQRGSGAAITDVAMKLGLPVRHVVAADRNGMTPEGGKAEIPAQPAFIQQVYQTESGEESDLFMTDDGASYAVKVTGITQPAVKPLDQVREQVREGFLTDARAKLLQTKAEALAEQARKSTSLAEVGRTLRRTPVTSTPLRRAQTDDVFSTNLSQQFFAAPPGAVITGPAAKGNGYVIARVAKIEHPEPDVSGAEYNQFRQTSAQELSETTIETLSSAARKAAGVNVHQATMQRIVGETQQ